MMRAKIQRFICLKRALVVSAFWTHDAEASASSDASASTYCRSEDVGILAVVMAKLELGKIKRQIFLAHVMVRAHDSAFEQAPERFEIVGMDLAAHVLMRLMVHLFVRKHLAEIAIASGLIGRHQFDLFRDGLADEARQGFNRRIVNYLADQIALARDCSDYRRLADRAAALGLVTQMAILILAADVGLIHFDNAHQFQKPSSRIPAR